MKKSYSYILAVIFCVSACSENKERSEDFAVAATDSVGTQFHEDFNSDIQLCTELFPPPAPNLHQPYQADTSIYYRDEFGNDTLVTTALVPTKAFIASLKDYQWDAGHMDISVSFLDGDSVLRRRVMQTAKIWERFCGIRFLFGDYSSPDISISFKYRGSWSYIGSYSTRMRPSMNFGWLTANSQQKEVDRVVLHEFGHALGFIHEHQNPNGNINWDVDKVYEYYMGGPNNWDKVTVDQNIFMKYNVNQVNATAFDPKSIMLYAIPADLTTDGYHTENNSQLSDLDKKHVAQIYPMPSK